MLIALFTLAFASPALATPAPVECFLSAAADAEIFPLTKKLYERTPNSTQVENLLRDLCAGAQEAQAPLQCFKEAMRNPEVMATTKRIHRGTMAEPAIEAAVAGLCAK